MINKLFPRFLNSSKDSRVRGKTEMKDAYNITVSSDYGDDYAAGNANLNEDGDVGVLKPAIGNQAQDLGNAFDLDNILEPNSGSRRVIGKVEDRKTGVIYFFLFCAEVNEMGVYAWDGENYFGTGVGVWRPIYVTPEFNFTPNTRVVGDIVHVSGGSDVDFRPILYFTDDENEPRKIDVLRCIEEGYTPALLNNYGPSDINDVDFITACPRMPVVPPTFEFFQESATRASDFRRVPGVQFAYQCIYAGGEESAISTYSDIAVPLQYVRQGTITGELDLPQICRITISPAPFGALTISEEVVAFKILVRRGNDGPFYVVDEVEKDGPFGTVTTYDFFNDRVLIGITESEEQKQYDNLPRLAQAMSVVENRLFYGNYVEGYDDVPLEASITPRYLPAGTSETAFELQATPIITYLGGANVDTEPTGSVIQQRVSGVAIDTSSLDSVLPAGTSISVSISFNPGKNIGLYDVNGGYHNSRIAGGVGPLDTYNQIPFYHQFDTGSPYNYADRFQGVNQNNLAAGALFFARGSGVGIAQDLQWVTTEDGFNGGGNIAPVDVVIGTSSATPLKIAGRPVEFSIELQTNSVIENAQVEVRNALGAALSGRIEYLPDGFTVVQNNNVATYNYNLGLRAPDLDSEAGLANLVRLGTGVTTFNSELAINVADPNADEDLLDMITAVYQANPEETNPCGYIVVNEANVAMRLEWQPNQILDDHGSLILTLEVDSLSNTDVLTAIPMLTCPDFRVRQWRIYDGPTLTATQITDIQYAGTLLSDYKFTGNASQTTNAAFFITADDDDQFLNRRRFIGYLRPSGTDLLTAEGNDIYISNNQRRSELELEGLTATEQITALTATGTSLFDTEGGLQFEIYETETFFTDYIELLVGDIWSFDIGVPVDANYKLVYKGSTAYEGSISSAMIMGGTLAFYADPSLTLTYNIPFQNHENPADFAVNNVHMQSLWGPNIAAYERKVKDGVFFAPRLVDTDAPSQAEGSVSFGGTTAPQFTIITGDLANTVGAFVEDLTFYLEPENPDEQLSEIEVVFNGFSDQVDLSGGFRSFKTSAYHDLGLVYYDNRGRPGNVNILPRTYVAGYSNEERNLSKGRVELEINIESAPPPWAHQYQIVYAGNTTYQDFIQYSVGGAFIDEVGDTDTGRNIYLSLNYLQNDDQVSYAESFGAVDPNGNKDLYTFVPGDQVRVISFSQNETVLSYPNQLVFDVIKQVTLTGNTASTTEEGRNPLDSGSADTPLYLQGNFLVLRDNPEATGFNWSAVRAQGNDLGGTQSNWNRRCIVEIVRPRAGVDSDLRSYQETGLVFNVARSTTGGAQGTPQGVYHQTPTIIMRNGDVWWRRVPVNLDAFADGNFVNLIPTTVEGDGEEAQDLNVEYQPRFRNRYLESKTFTDTFPGADVNGYGKRKFYSPEAAEVRRESSIIYSDANDFSTRRVRFTSFNPFQAPFKDLPNQYGAINALVEFSEYLFVVQQDKCSVVPINRNILSDASGGDQLISSDKIIGKQKFISGRYGADNNRESVIKIDESVYFAHREKGEVYRYKGGKIEVISRQGVAGFLYNAFQDNIPQANMRVVSGYDPLKDEYIISIINLPGIAYVPPSLFTQPYLDPFVFDPTGSLGNAGGTSTGVIPGGVTTDFDTDIQDPIADLVEEEVVVGGVTPDGVAPTGTPDDSIISTAINNKDDIIEILNGTPRPDTNPLTDTSFLQDQIDTAVSNGDEVVGLGFSDYIPSSLGSVLGNNTYHVLGGRNVGSFQGNTLRIPNLSIADAQLVVDELNTNLQTVTPSEYHTFLSPTGFVTGLNLRGILNVRNYELVDNINDTIVAIKNQYEAPILSLVNNIKILLEDIEQDIEDAFLQENLTLSSLLGEANQSYDALNAYVTDTLQGGESTEVVFLASNRTSETVSGFGLFGVGQFPLEDENIFKLSFINSLVENIGESVRPLLQLDAVDVSDVLSNFRESNAELRQQVDVLTNQVQNLSAAPVETTGDTFIPEVTTNQITQQALTTYAGSDGVLTQEDVVTQPELTAQIQQIIELYGNTTAAPNTEITEDLVISITGEIIKEIAQESGATGDAFTIRGNPFIPTKGNEEVLRNVGNLFNPLDLTGPSGLPDGTFGVDDILQTLNAFGTNDFYGGNPDESGGAGAIRKTWELFQSSDPYAQYFSDWEAGFAGLYPDLAGNVTAQVMTGVLWYVNGPSGNNSAATATSYADLEVQHTDYPPPAQYAIGDIYSFVNLVGLESWIANFTSGILAEVKRGAQDPLGPYGFWFANPGKTSGTYVSQFGIPLFSRFGEQLTSTLSQEQLLTIVQNAIANNQAE